MAIDLGSIMSKVNAYASSSAGQKKMNDTIQSYIRGSDPRVKASGKTYGGGKIMTEKEMIDAAKDLISMMRTAAGSAGLPASVMEHVESLMFSTPYIAQDGSASIEIFMSDAPGRPSLYLKKHSGVENIVALFNAGYEADGRVYGTWHDKKTVSLDKRQGSFFMQKAVDKFMAKYAGTYDISVELDPTYNGA